MFREFTAAEREALQRNEASLFAPYRNLSPVDAIAFVQAQLTSQSAASLVCDACRETDPDMFHYLFAPIVRGVPSVVRLLVDDYPDPFSFLGSGLYAGVTLLDGEEVVLGRLRSLRHWGYLPRAPVKAIFAFTFMPACFEYMLSWCGASIEPSAPLGVPETSRALRYFGCSRTQGGALRYLAADNCTFYQASREIALEFIADMARTYHSKLTTQAVLRKNFGLAGFNASRVFESYDVRPHAVCAFTERWSGAWDHSLTCLADVRKYIDAPSIEPRLSVKRALFAAE